MWLHFYPDNEKQRRLIERYLLSVSAYALCVSIAWIAKVASLTNLSCRVLTAGSLAITIYLISIYMVYRTGLNGRVADSAFTRFQMFVAIVWISFFIWSTQDLRGAMLLIYLFVAMFSLFTLDPRQTAAMALTISLLYAAVIVLDWWSLRVGFDLTVNVIQWGILSATLVWLSAIARYITGVRDRVRQSNRMIRTQNAEIQHTNKKLEGAMAELNRMVTRDELTGLSNRRHFLEVINEHIARSRNERFGFGLCVLDVDNFKQINDTFGHLVGDKVLRAAADLMRQNMREYDFLARFGGEEFTLIITRGDEPTTRRCAERLRRAIADAELSDLEENVELTVSIGATMFQRGDTLEAALARADAAMYKAKQAGRNAFVMKLAVGLPASN